MRLHHLWPRKLQNCTIPVNLEAIRTTMIASKLFQPLYLGYNRCDLAISTYPWHSHPIGILGLICYLWIYPQEVKSLQSSTETASYDLGFQLQHVPSISSVHLDSLKLSFDSVFSRYHGLFWSSVYFNTDFSSIMASRILCSLIGLLRTTQHFLIWHSTSLLRLQLVELSQFMHFTCKFLLF